MTGQQIGVLIGVIAGGSWALAGSASLRGAPRVLAMIVSLVGSILLAVATARLPSNGEAGRFDGAIYGIAVTAEAIAIVVAVPVLRRLGRGDWLVPVIAMIVGLHFLGLWRATGDAVFVGLAAGLCAIGIMGVRVPASWRMLVVGFGCALVLWAAAAATILSS